jgi:hypothetical protein
MATNSQRRRSLKTRKSHQLRKASRKVRGKSRKSRY